MKEVERALLAKKIVAYLKRKYPEPKSELSYKTPFQFVTAVILSAQCTDKAVNKVTETLFNKYKTAKDFADANPAMFAKGISPITAVEYLFVCIGLYYVFKRQEKYRYLDSND